MIRYLTGDEIKESIKVDGITIFTKGCFNCSLLIEKLSNVSGRCPFYKVDVWKDWTCEKHDAKIKKG
jgi:hypothetical protein